MVGKRGLPSLDDCKKRVIAAIVALYKYDREPLEVGASERSISHKLRRRHRAGEHRAQP